MSSTEYLGVDQGAAVASDVAGPAPEAPPHRGRARVVGGALVAASLLALVGTRHFSSHAVRQEVPRKTDMLALSEGSGGKTTGCGGPEEECTSSHCCQDGGDGLQCYAKNDGWAQCLASCEEGVHAEETHGTYDKMGRFLKDEWSCKKLGKRSQKGCDSLDSKKSCQKEKDRCFWGWKDAENRACKQNCSSVNSGGACKQHSHCMWHEDVCKPACNTYVQEKECPFETCAWKDDKCKPACWTMMDADTCGEAKWEQACIWQGGQCIVDPCAAGNENCIDAKCCSAARGGQGKTCFQKDKYYGKCMDFCEEEGWKCKELGNRTKWEAGCSWIGHDCGSTHLCCQEGAECVVKDADFTGCVQTKTISTWYAMDVQIPEDWEGTSVGGCRKEYEMPAATGEEERASTTMFCFMAYLPDSEEVQLMLTAKDANASIYACDEYAAFKSWKSGVQQWDTGEGGASLTNTDVFLNVWEQVRANGRYLHNDWTVKVDPDALLVPHRLKAHIAALNPPANKPIYLKNNGMDAGLGNNGFLGAFEVFTRQAVQRYLDNSDGCKEAFGLDTGEDGFLKGCMDALGVGFMLDENLFKPDFSPGACVHEDMAGFHPLKDHANWLCCHQIIQGHNRLVVYGKCDMGPDGKGPAVEPDHMFK